MANKIYRVFKLVLHTTYTCNMACKGCVTLNDQPRTGVESYDELVASWERWSEHIDPKWVVVFGGEPLMHPRFKDLYQQLRRIWPEARIMIPTNGLLLKKALDRAWIDSIKPVEFRISLHRPDMKEQWFKDTIKDFMALYPSWKTTRDEVLAAGDNMPHLYSQHHNGVYLSISYYDDFIVPYQLIDGKISPYDNDPESGFQACVSQENVYVYKGQLWKCFPYPNLKDTVADFNARWPGYRPYGPDDDLDAYFANISRAERICGMCPTPEQSELSKVPHSQNVKVLPSSTWMQKLVNKG